MRLSVAVAVLLAAGPASAAGERIDLLALETPPLVVADHAFDTNVTLANRLDTDVTAVLYAVLYAADGGGPCGAQTEARWRGVVSLRPAYAEVALAAGETRTLSAWTWRIPARAVDEAGTYEVCVFAGEQGGAAPPGGLAHEDLLSAPLDVRPTNEPPVATFTWSPSRANVTTPFTFVASATDADGDTVTFAWDFGDRTAKGAATAVGPVATHRFYPEGDYRVELAASDGFATTRVHRTVHVLPEEVPTPLPDETPRATPAGLAALATALVALALRRRA